MGQPLPADYFVQHAGVDAATSAQLAAEHNAAAGFRTDAAPVVSSAEAPAPRQSAPLSPPHEAKVASRAAELQKLTGVDAATARSVAEQEFAYRSGSGADRSAMLHQLEASRTEQAITDSIDAGMELPRAPHEYTMPSHDGSEDAVEIDQQMRDAMFNAAVPREIGNSLARQVNETAAHLLNASDAEIDAYCTQNKQTLQRMWGPQYEHRLGLVKELLLTATNRSPALKALFTDHPELFAHWSVADALARVAESRHRSSKA